LPTTDTLSFVWQTAKSKPHTVATQLVGDYNLTNALAAVAIGVYFGVDGAAIDRALTAYRPTNNRSQRLQTGNNTLVVDAYNANPSSMMAALENFARIDATDKLLILGDMLELGAESATEHQAIVDYLTCHPSGDVILVGAQFAALTPPFPTYPDADALIAALQNYKPVGRTILLKGSHGVHLEKLVAYL
jgi:UDP-N-acetylmuramoyl-tripeptide--D-alanyl-D-alanine ligase